jgi:hypothetical protein
MNRGVENTNIQNDKQIGSRLYINRHLNNHGNPLEQINMRSSSGFRSITLSGFCEIAAILLGLLYVVLKVAKPALPFWARWIEVGFPLVLFIGWLVLNRRYLSRELAGELFSRSWPFWLCLLGLRDPFSGSARMVLTDLILCGLLCSMSVVLGKWIAAVGPRIPCRFRAPWVAWALALLYAAVFFLLPSLRYWGFRSYWMDLGLMVQPIWNTAHGRLFEFTWQGQGSSASEHFSPIFLLVAPFYRIFPFTETLFAIQALANGAAGMILFSWARRTLESTAVALLLLAAFFLWFPLQFALICDFHADPLLVPFLMMALWAYEQKRPVLFWLGLIVCLSGKEYMGFALTPLLLILAIRPQWRRSLIGASIFFIGYSWFAHTAIIPHYNQGVQSLGVGMLYPGGNQGLGGLISTMAHNPLGAVARLFSAWNLEQLCWIFGSLLFVPLAVVPEILALSPLVFKEAYGAFYLQNHHQSIMAPLLFWCIIIFVKKRDRRHRLIAAASIAAACLLFGFLGGDSPISHRFWRTLRTNYLPDAHRTACAGAVATIPDGASVAASSNIAVHLCNRRLIYLFPKPLLDAADRPLWRVDSVSPPPNAPDYVVFDGKHREIGHEIRTIIQGNRDDNEVRALFGDLRRSGFYRTVFERDGVVVLRRSAAAQPVQ